MSLIDWINVTLGLGLGFIVGLWTGIVAGKGRNIFMDEDGDDRW